MALALKVVLVPVLLWAITWAGRVLGPRIAGMLTGIPLVAGPLVVFIALEQGPAFAARSATSTLSGQAALVTFCMAYSLGARRFRWWQCVLLGWATFLCSTAILNRFDFSTAECLAIGLTTPLIMRWGLGHARKALTHRPEEEAARVAPANDLIWRMVAGAALVVLLTSLARGLGPRLSGLLTIFPVATAVLAAFSHRAHGAAFSVDLLRGLALGMYSFTTFFAVVALSIEALGTALAVALALLGAVAVQGGLLLLVLRRQPAVASSLR